MSTGQAIFWIATGVIVAAGVVWLVTRWIAKGTNPGLPTTTQYDTQDAPPADADVANRQPQT